jgi:uncharacterized membrane protein YdjX (TVP38/TMEM64 family)
MARLAIIAGMARPVLRLIPAILLVLIAGGVFAGGGLSVLSPTGLVGHAQSWRDAAAREPVLSLSVYVGAYTAIIAAGLPVALILTIAGGVIFGAIEGALAAMVAANLAALIAYGASRTALGAWLSRWLDRRPGSVTFLEELRARGFWAVIAARLVPVMPFSVVNVAAGVARVPLKAFAGATLLGALPSGVICSSLGAGLGGSLTAASLGDAMRSPWLWAPMLGLASLSVLPIIYARRRNA